MKLAALKFFLAIIVFIGGFSSFTLISNENAQQQEKQEILKPSYEVEVVVTNVQVIVADKNGNRITGLKPENFEIYEDDLLQKLTNFYEVKGMEVYASVPEKDGKKLAVSSQPTPRVAAQTNKIIFYFDNWHLHPMSRNWSEKKLEPFIQNNFSQGGNNQGMVVCLDQKLEILQELTSNKGELLQAINQVKKRTGQSLLRIKEREDLQRELNQIIADPGIRDKFENYERAFSFARNFVEAAKNDLEYSLKSLSAFMSYLTGIEGKKILIYMSDGLPLNPSEEVFGFLDQAFPLGNARTEAMNYDATRQFKELTAECNANEIAIYPINALGLESLILSADKQAGWNIYSRGSGMIKSGSRARNSALNLMAEDTGGLAILDTNDIESGMKKIESDLQFYYSLGFVSPHREDDVYRPIKVELVGVEDDYDVRVRKGYTRISVVEKIKDAVLSRLYLPRQSNPLKVMVQVMPVEPMPRSDKLRLIIKLLLPIKNLTLYAQNNDYVGQVKVYFALMDAGNNISPCYELTEDIKIPAKDYKIALQSSYPYLTEMHVSPGSYILSFAVKDIPSESICYIQFQKLIEKK